MQVSYRCRRPFWATLVATTVLAAVAFVAVPAEAEVPTGSIGLRPVTARLAVAPVPAVDPALAAAVAPAANPAWLPTPAPLPDPSARVALVEIGRVQIPRTGVDQIVREGVEQAVIDAGPAHWPGTAAFGGWGNVVLAGHRTNETAPFLRNGELVPGDLMVLSDATGSYSYRVTELEVVDATALWIVDQHPGRTLTIFTCHPIGSSAQRLVVRAELVTRPRAEA